MTKYIVYAEDDNNPGKQIQIRKMKREYEAIDFVGDIRNLQRYGCMSIIQVTDDGEKYAWNNETSVWERMED